jgi:hypothetical protein
MVVIAFLLVGATDRGRGAGGNFSSFSEAVAEKRIYRMSGVHCRGEASG